MKDHTNLLSSCFICKLVWLLFKLKLKYNAAFLLFLGASTERFDWSDLKELILCDKTTTKIRNKRSFSYFYCGLNIKTEEIWNKRQL